MPRLAAAFALLFLSSVAHADPAKKPPPVGTVGTIKGTVIFEGEPPERAPLKRDSDPYCAKFPRTSDDVVVTKGKLRDVLVRIKNGSGGKAPAAPAPAVIDQRECMYSPRVVGIVAGQTLTVRNSDGTFHNVHGTIAGKQQFNKPHGPKDADLTFVPTGKPDDVIDIVCDIHPWMHSYAVVQDHPYFAITGDDGTFELKGMPPGTYTLEAWHPTLGAKTMTVKVGVGPKATINARFSYKQ